MITVIWLLTGWVGYGFYVTLHALVAFTHGYVVLCGFYVCVCLRWTARTVDSHTDYVTRCLLFCVDVTVTVAPGPQLVTFGLIDFTLLWFAARVTFTRTTRSVY